MWNSHKNQPKKCAHKKNINLCFLYLTKPESPTCNSTGKRKNNYNIKFTLETKVQSYQLDDENTTNLGKGEQLHKT